MERDRFDNLKRQFFLMILPIVSLAGLAELVMGREAGTNLLVALPALFIPLALSLLLWWKRRSLRFVETATLTWVVAALLGLLYADLFIYQGDQLDRFASFSPWFAVCLIAIYLVFGPRRATWISAGIYLVALGMGLTYLVTSRLAGETPLLLRPLMHLYLASAAFISFLSYSSRLREQFERTHHLARSMADLAHTDPLLGIPNRRQLSSMLRDEIRLEEEGMKPGVILMFDLDRFKEVNDTYGHEAGDQVLKAIVTAVKQTLRSSDRFGRWGGDEFVVLASVADMSQANMLAQRLREAVHQRLGERFWQVTLSIGVAPFHRGDTVETWMNRADQALYRAKESGRNRVVVGS